MGLEVDIGVWRHTNWSGGKHSGLEVSLGVWRLI